MNPSLNIGNSTISFDRVVDGLNRFGLFPQLLQEIVTDDFVAEMNLPDLSEVEYNQHYLKISNLPICRGMNEHQLQAICDRDLRLQQFKLAQWGDRVDSYFTGQSDGLDRVTLSILQVEDALLAQELFFRIQSGEQSFAEIAVEYSQGQHADNGGVLGPLLWRELNPNIMKVIEKLKPGQLSPLIKIDNNYTLFRLDEREPAQLDDLTHQFILNELFLTWLRSQVAGNES
jgi:PPIC-type PPIASE domain